MNYLMSMTVTGPSGFSVHTDSERKLMTSQQVLKRLTPGKITGCASVRRGTSPFHHWLDDTLPKLTMLLSDGQLGQITVGFYAYEIDQDGDEVLGDLVSIYRYTCDNAANIVMTADT